ncbi:PP2C family serine/threonine-protein phosphatase [Arthrobacter sp. SDTb3-6]|uniref:PP2C family protein-serine/threonine phosphatase n=1 Tax=Arthrobacter sp. SDTb3-6 TaxID=2713571 RepID=UPI00159EA6A1|nr:protein phosphatase 2C domain-containing protein [Arthrobacter sp. SDTb3-6]NVM99185.1 serine/threonine-protein phosphatase [Arthrobacter sp. SDTb3-6]
MAEHPLILRYAARSHMGLVRAKNDDSAYAGKHLAVVADGMGGHAGGDVASASTVLDLIHLDRDGYEGDDAGTHLADEIQTANSLLSELVHVNPKLAGMGTTVTALLLSGQRLAYAHIGDSRAYRFKNGVFEQMSTDHTFVQRMIDEGRMTEAEAEVHPHKNVLMRVLGDVDASPELDLKFYDVEPGERWLLCSDGLNFVRHEMVEEVVRHTSSLAHCAETLIDLTLAAGSPDNVTVVVFDVAEATPEDTATAALDTVAGAWDDDGETDAAPDDAAPANGSGDDAVDGDGSGTVAGEPSGQEDDGEPTAGLDAHIRAAVVRRELEQRPHELVGAALTANAEGKIPLLAHHPAVQRAATVLTHKPVDAALQEDDTEQSLPRVRYRRWLFSLLGVVATIVVVAGAWTAVAWTQTQYFVGSSHGNVAIFQGVSQNLGPFALSHLERETSVSVQSLPEYSQQLVAQTVPAASLSAAEQIIVDLRLGTGTGTPPCARATATPSPGATAGATAPHASAKPTAKATAKATARPTATHAPAKATARGTAKPSGTASPSATPTCTPGGGQ